MADIPRGHTDKMVSHKLFSYTVGTIVRGKWPTVWLSKITATACSSCLLSSFSFVCSSSLITGVQIDS